MEVEKYHIIASHHMINSKADVHGPSRLGDEVHVGVGQGSRGIVMGNVRRPEGMDEHHQKERSRD